MPFPINLLEAKEKEPVSTPKPVIYEIKDKAQLYSFYMPFLNNGGLFIPTPTPLPPESRVLILLTLPDDKQRKTISGKVCWLTPPNAHMGISQGMGVHFDDSEQCRLVRSQIENMLAGILGRSESRTMTI